MNKSFDDDIRFDRLVDGELPADEYRALIAALDDEPGGWRRCAMAFLESQALAGELAGVRKGLTLSDDAIQSPVPLAEKNSPAARKNPFRLTTLLAMAASFLVAFALGIVVPRWFLAGSTGEPMVAEAPGEKPEITSVATSDNQITGQPRIQSFKPIGNLQFVVNGPGESSTPIGDVPFYEYPGSADEWLNDQQPALSAEVLQTLEDRGHRIERQVEYVPVLLEDGRQVIVPIERYQIRPAQQLPY